MKLLQIDELNIEAQLMGDRVFIYSAYGSDILFIEDIENKENAEDIIIREIELQNRSSLSSLSSLVEQ